MTRSLLIDTDPGVDDALAIFMALAAPELAPQALISVAGNVGQDKTTRNALTLLELAGRCEVPVVAGARQPLRRPPHVAKVHGSDGLGDSGFPPPDGRPVGDDAVAWYRDFLAQRPPGSVGLAALGPLTNLAQLIEAAPEAWQAFGEVVVMGGATPAAGGNVTPFAEFNFYVDPDAADRVFAQNRAVTLVPLDLAYGMKITTRRLTAMTAGGGRAAAALRRMLAHYGKGDGHLYDPLTVAWLLWPELFQARRAFLRIETEGPEAGACRFDWQPEGPVRVLLGGDAEALFARLAALLGRL